MVGRSAHSEVTDRLVSMLVAAGASRIALFGSYARGEERGDSDIDVLVSFADRKGLLDLVGIEQNLCEAVHRKVDLVTQNSLDQRLRPAVERDLVVLYG